MRLFKTRSMATNAVKAGKVLVGGEEVKPSRTLKTGEIVTLRKHNALFSYEVLELLEKRVGAKLVETYLRDVTPPEEVEKYKEYLAAQRSYRDNGLGRPSKKDRRDLKRFRGW